MSNCDHPGPGPAYAFGGLTGYEGHDFTKNRAPAYSLGLKTGVKQRMTTPGPYYVGNVDRNGRLPYSGWTIESKSYPHSKFVGPSPLSYAPEKMKSSSPAYSLGLKLPPRGQSFGPSPADYFPQYSNQGGITIGHAWRSSQRHSSPGPSAAVPIDLYKNKAPAYSLGLKGRPFFLDAAGPGPKYHPGNAGQATPHAYSFGVKHWKCSPPLITYEDNN